MDKHPKNITQEQQETFERFLLNQMDQVEKEAFISALEHGTELSQNFEEFKMLFLAVEEDGLRQKLHEFHEHFKDTKNDGVKSLPRRRRKNLMIAASIAALVTIGGFWLFNRKSPNERLFDTHFSPDPGLPTVMGSQANYSFYEAMVDYKRGNYSIAIQKWEQLQRQQPDNDTLNYFLASAYLANGDHQKSIPFFKTITEKDSASFLDEALYYLGLTQLKNNQKDDAIPYLEASKDNRGKIVLSKIEK